MQALPHNRWHTSVLVEPFVYPPEEFGNLAGRSNRSPRSERVDHGLSLLSLPIGNTILPEWEVLGKSLPKRRKATAPVAFRNGHHWPPIKWFLTRNQNRSGVHKASLGCDISPARSVRASRASANHPSYKHGPCQTLISYKFNNLHRSRGTRSICFGIS